MDNVSPRLTSIYVGMEPVGTAPPKRHIHWLTRTTFVGSRMDAVTEIGKHEDDQDDCANE